MKATCVAIAALLLSAATASSLAESRPPDAKPDVSRATEIEAEPGRIASGVLARLDAAWNAANGARFAAEFTGNADLVNIFGERYKGRPEVAKRMQFIFDGMFKGSTHRARNLEIARYLSADTILAVSSTRVSVPSGPLSPETRNRQTFILVKQGDAWRIRHWHNTTMRPSN